MYRDPASGISSSSGEAGVVTLIETTFSHRDSIGVSYSALATQRSDTDLVPIPTAQRG